MSVHKDKTLLDNNRTLLNLQRSEVERALPEHIRAEYPNLLKLFDYYYEWLDSADNFGGMIHQLYRNRDAIQVPDRLLEFLEDELLLGQSYFGGFQNKREAVKFSNLLYRSKGSKYSIQQFFRGFFGIDPTISYPKEQIFKVGPEIDFDKDSINLAGQQIKVEASKIGPESRKYITDDKLYQVMSILIRTSIPFEQWRDVYKLFVHPAGVYVGGQILLELVNVDWNNIEHNPLLDNNGAIDYRQDEKGDDLESLLSSEFEGDFALTADFDVTLINKGDGTIGMQRQRVDQTFVSDVGYLTMDQIDNGYDIRELLSPNSVTMDDSDTRTTATSDAVDFSQDLDPVLRIGVSTFDEHTYSTLFDSATNSADSANYPF